MYIASLQQQTDHTWSIATNNNLFVGESPSTAGSGQFEQANSSILSLDGGGTISISLATAAIRLGDTSAFTGSLNTNGTDLALVADTAESITFGGTLSGTTTISKSGAGTYELPGASFGSSVDVSAGTLVLSGNNTFSDNALTKAGAGSLLLTGSNSYTGLTTISAGTLQVGDGGTTGSIGSGNIVLSQGATLAFNRSDDVGLSNQWESLTGGGTRTLRNDGTGLVTLAGNSNNIGAGGTSGEVLVLDGSGNGLIEQSFASGGADLGIRKEGAGTWTFTNDSNGYSGATTISEGTLQIGNGGATGTIGTGDLELSAGATLAFNRTAPLTVANDWISFTDGGIRTLRNDGTGKITLDGGNIGLSEGTTTLALVGSGDGEIAQSIAAGGAEISIAKEGAGTWTLSNAATNYSGSTTITAGTLEVSGLLGAGNYGEAIANDGELHINSASAQTLSGDLSGSGLLRKSAAGTLTLSGTNTYTGGTTLAGGTLALGSADALGSTGTITLSGGTLQFSASNTTDYSARFATVDNQAFNFDTNGQDVTLATGLTSSSGGSLAKSGTGTLVLSAASSYDGSTTISAGTLRIADGGSLGTGNIDIPDGTLEFTRSTATTLANQLNVSGTGSAPAILNNGSGLLTLQPGTDTNINVDNGETFTVGGSGDILIEKSIASGAGASLLTKTGSGTVTLTSADNNWSGGTTISAGVLQVGDGTSDGTIGTGTITITNGRLAFNRSSPYTVAETIATFQDGTTPGIENNGAGLLTVDASNIGFSVGASGITLDLGGTGDGLMDGPIASGGAAANILKDGTGTWTFDDADTNYSGTTTVSAGTLEITGRLGQGSYAQTISNDATLRFNSASAQTLSGVLSGAGTLHKSNTGTVSLEAANTFSGLLLIDGGSLALAAGGSLAAAVSAEVNGGTFDIAGKTQTIAALNGTGGTVDLGAGSLSVANASANTYAGAIAGTGSLAKSGAGDLVLSGANTYTGTTSVSAGRLSVNGSLANTAVTVAIGAELGGSGSILGSLSIDAAGTLSPGNSIASLAAGDTSFDAGATFAYEVDSTTPGSLASAADLLVVNGSLSITPGTILTFTDLNGSPNAFPDGTVFALINYTDSWDNGLFTYSNTELADGDSFFVGAEEWRIDYNATSGGVNFTGDYQPSSSFVTVTAVPEPSTYVMLAIAGGIAAVAARRRRKA